LLNTHLSLNNDKLKNLTSPLNIYAQNDEIVTSGNSNGESVIKLNEIKKDTINSFIAIEDNNFYNHKGINVKRMIKALMTNISSREYKEGASTISQQLIKNTHLTSTKTIDRKVKEILLTLKLEKKYTKNEIMELYLNAIYFGSGCYGIESASNFYFNKSAKDLSLNESAILAGIIKSPKYYSPINFPESCLQRKNLVLKQMKKLNFINDNIYNENIIKDLELNIDSSKNNKSLSYVNGVITEASQILNVSTNSLNNYKIYTYFDNNKQNILNNLSIYNNNVHQNAIIVDNNSGGVQAFISSIKYGATLIKRQPASTIKPLIVYAPAIENGLISPATKILDEKTSFNGYTPQNINDTYYGNISCRKALSESLNIPAIKILEKVGINNAKKYGNKLGLEFDEKDNGLSLALGGLTNGITILDLCSAYSPIFNSGNLTKVHFIKKIIDQNNKVVYENKESKQKVMNEGTATLVNSMMQTCAKEGTCKTLKSLPFEVASKSGTASINEDNNTDLLCMAGTSENTCCVWYFSQTNRLSDTLSKSLSCSLSPTKKVKEILSNIYDKNCPKNFTKSKEVVDLMVDNYSYENENKIMLVGPSTPDRYMIKEEFLSKYAPSEISTIFEEPISTNLNLKENDNDIILSFTTSPFFEYTLYKVVDNEPTIFSIIKDKSGEITINAEKDSATYYLEIKGKYSKKMTISNLVYFLNKNSLNKDNNSKKISSDKNNETQNSSQNSPKISSINYSKNKKWYM
jgi:penicillin-binding protein 2A